jgi:uncharacterized cupin superfamily protein
VVRKLNVVDCRELDESLDEAGFRHDGAAIGRRIGAERIGAGLYDAVADHPIWPYHYHYGTEEWLYVISGKPMLRDPGGRRTLGRGDLVCFPANHQGAHTVYGPGRVVIFSTNESSGPWMSVYPDSDKIGVAPGVHEATALNALRLPRSGAVDYWHGEGTAYRPDPVRIEREPTTGPGRPVINALTVALSDPADDAPAGFRFRAAAVGPALGGAGLGATVVELDPGEGSEPYHYEHGREEWVLVLAGTPTLRHPDGTDVLHAGDVVCWLEGPDGAHRLINHGHQVTRAIFLETRGLPANICYPDSGTWTLRNGPDDTSVALGQASPIGDWER